MLTINIYHFSWICQCACGVFGLECLYHSMLLAATSMAYFAPIPGFSEHQLRLKTWSLYKDNKQSQPFDP